MTRKAKNNIGDPAGIQEISDTADNPGINTRTVIPPAEDEIYNEAVVVAKVPNLNPIDTKWLHLDVLAEWGEIQSEKNFWKITDVLTDEMIAAKFAQTKLPDGVAEQLLQNWVEMVHQQLYRVLRKDESHQLYASVLYLSLNADFMPAKNEPIQLAYRAEQNLVTAELFLRQLKRWASRDGGKHPLGSLGWLVVRPEKPGLVMCWDELIPHVHYQQYWSQSRPGEVLKNENGKLILWVTPRVGKPHKVAYKPTGHEAEGLEPRDRVRYWEDINGNGPFLLPEAPFSPYILTKRKVWDRMDDYAYKLDPAPIG